MKPSTVGNANEVHDKLLTVADLVAFPAELPTGPVRYELLNGRLRIMHPPGGLHGFIESDLVYQLKVQGEHRGHGKAASGGPGVILWRNPDRVVGPDGVFFSNGSLPVRLSPEGYFETIPDLVAEVRSKNDADAEIDLKVADYLKAGVRVVLVLDSKKRTIAVHRAKVPPLILGSGDELSLDDVIPGFRMAVSEAFRSA